VGIFAEIFSCAAARSPIPSTAIDRKARPKNIAANDEKLCRREAIQVHIVAIPRNRFLVKINKPRRRKYESKLTILVSSPTHWSSDPRDHQRGDGTGNIWAPNDRDRRVFAVADQTKTAGLTQSGMTYRGSRVGFRDRSIRIGLSRWSECRGAQKRS